MGTITFITGGATSGKTRWAISFFKTRDNVLFMNTDPKLSKEDENRMDYSNKENDVSWVVENGVTDPVPCIKKDHQYYILDNLCGLTMNVIKQQVADPENMTRQEHDRVRFEVINSIIECMNKVISIGGSMVIITTEMGFSPPSKDRMQMIYRKIMGEVNQRIANTVHEVYISVSGIQYRIK